jgi:hypothetical protein
MRAWLSGALRTGVLFPCSGYRRGSWALAKVAVVGELGSGLAPGILCLYFSKNGILADNEGVSGVLGYSTGGGVRAETILGSGRKWRGGEGEGETA